MGPRFPLFLDLQKNNCVIVGGGAYATQAAKLLLQFGAKVTVVSPTLCEVLTEVEKAGGIRHIPRRYFRGDCANAYVAVAATDDEAVNIAVSQECKARHIPVNVATPAVYGTFVLPELYTVGSATVALCPGGEEADRERLRATLTRSAANRAREKATGK